MLGQFKIFYDYYFECNIEGINPLISISKTIHDNALIQKSNFVNCSIENKCININNQKTEISDTYFNVTCTYIIVCTYTDSNRELSLSNTCFQGSDSFTERISGKPTITNNYPSNCAMKLYTSVGQEDEAFPFATVTPSKSAYRTYPEDYQCIETKRFKIRAKALHKLVPSSLSIWVKDII